MKRLPRWVLTVAGVFAAFVATWGCGPKDTGQAVSTPPEGWQQAGRMGGGPGGPGGPGGRGGFGGGGRSGSPIGQVMRKLNDRTPGSPRNVGEELKADPPAWDTIQGQTGELAKAASELEKLDPPQGRGTKESWTTLTAAFAATATELDKAAHAKDLATAQGAVTKLQNSCEECHVKGGFRGQGGGRGGPGGGRPGGPGGGSPGGPPGGGS
jgi:hypothetical protein